MADEVSYRNITIPECPEAESDVIAGMFQSKAVRKAVYSILSERHIHHMGLNLLFSAMVALDSREIAVSFGTVKNEVAQRGASSDIDWHGAEQLSRVGIPAPGLACANAEVVKKTYRARELIRTGLDMSHAASQPEADPDVLITTFDDKLQALAGEEFVVSPLAPKDVEDWSYLTEPPPYRPLGILGTEKFYNYNAQPGVYTLNGLGGAGKTWLAINAAHYHTGRDGRVLYLSTEMVFKRCKQRLAALALGVPFGKVVSPWDFTGPEPLHKITDEDAAQIREFCDTGWSDGMGRWFMFRNVSGRSLESARSLIHAVTREKGPFSLVILDHVTGLDTKGVKEWEFQAIAARALVDIAVRLVECPVLVVQHPTTGEDRGQWASGTARGGNAWKNLAEACFALNFLEMQDGQRLLDLECSKSRDGNTGEVGLLMNTKSCRFTVANRDDWRAARNKSRYRKDAEESL